MSRRTSTSRLILYRLDPRQFQIALDNAKANLAETALSIEAMKEDYKRMLSDAAAQQAQVDLDQVNHDRYATLLRTATVSKATFDQAIPIRISSIRCTGRPRRSSQGLPEIRPFR